MSSTILVTGAGGQVGQALAGAPSPHRIVALSRSELDITVAAEISRVLAATRPDFLINAAAYTQVDRAEEEPEQAYAVNRDGVLNLANACRPSNTPLLHISTDYVFAGDKKGAYVETDPVAPLGVYGKSKADGEALLRANLDQYIILRTSWVFSATGSNFVKTMLRLGRERGELGIVADQKGCPTSASSIAAASLQIADRYLKSLDVEWGTYHYCNRPETTWYGFAEAIFEQAGMRELILREITTSDYPTPAARPKNSVLECDKAEANFGLVQTNWKSELSDVLRCLSVEKIR